MPVRNSRLKYFYPRSPCGERQYDPELYTPYALISIHALLAESDTMHHLRCPRSRDFYPRSPCGERPIFAVRPYDAPIFLSTLSLRRATGGYGCAYLYLIISIHALLAESDLSVVLSLRGDCVFLSTLSLRRATPLFRLI